MPERWTTESPARDDPVEDVDGAASRTAPPLGDSAGEHRMPSELPPTQDDSAGREPSPGRRDLRSGRVVARRAPDPTGELGFPLGRRRAPRRVGRVAQPERSRQRVTGTGGDAGGLRDRPDDVRRAGRCVAEVAALGPGRSVRVARSGSRQPKIPRAWNTASRAAEIARSRSDAATTCSGSTPCGCWPASGRAGSR